jgi:hypothetical protein
MKNKKINNAFFNLLAKAAKDNSYDKPQVMTDGDSPRAGCKKLIDAATTFDELFNAIPSCVVTGAYLAKSELGTGWLAYFMGKFSSIWSAAVGSVVSTGSFLQFWTIFCSKPFQDALVAVVTKLINVMRGAGIAGEYGEALIMGIAQVLGQTFTGIPSAAQFFRYFIGLAVDGDIGLMKKTIKALCDRINRSRDMGNAFAEENARHLFDQLIYLLSVVAGSISLGVGYASNLAESIYEWMIENPGQVLTIAAIVAIAAVIIWGTGGLGAPAIPQMAAAVLALAAALGITHDFTQEDIERMINESQGA